MTNREDVEVVDPPVTTLEGKSADPSALTGVPNTLYELHLSLLSVERLDT